MKKRGVLREGAGTEAAAGLAHDDAKLGETVIVRGVSEATGAVVRSIEMADAKSGDVKLSKTTGAKTEPILPYKTRWAVWVMIGVSFFGCLAAVVLRGGATEWFGLTLLTGIIVISGLFPIISIIGLRAERFLSIAQIEAGEQAQIELRISRTVRNPFVWIAAEDQAKHVNGMEGRGATHRGAGLLYFGRHWMVRYRLEGLTRGEYAFTSVTIAMGDWLGLTSISRRIACASELLVLPSLPEERLEQPRMLPGEARNAAMLAGHGPDTRLYREGDSLRHLDFRAAARGRGWHTKIHRIQSRTELLLLIDQRENSYGGKDLLFDACIGWACRFVRIRAELGHRVAMAAKDWRFQVEPSGKKGLEESEHELREQLAGLSALKQDGFLERAVEEAGNLPAGSVLQIFTGGLQNVQRWIELAGILEMMSLRLELYGVASSPVPSFAMREQQKLLEGRGIDVTWLSALGRGMNQTMPQDGGDGHAITS